MCLKAISFDLCHLHTRNCKCTLPPHFRWPLFPHHCHRPAVCGCAAAPLDWSGRPHLCMVASRQDRGLQETKKKNNRVRDEASEEILEQFLVFMSLLVQAVCCVSRLQSAEFVPAILKWALQDNTGARLKCRVTKCPSKMMLSMKCPTKMDERAGFST